MAQLFETKTVQDLRGTFLSPRSQKEEEHKPEELAQIKESGRMSKNEM